MPARLSEVLGVAATALEQEGAFNGFYRFDSKFHIDPALLRITSAPELRRSADRLETHFSNILRLLDRTKDITGPIWNQAVKSLLAPEINAAALGYSSGVSAGRAIGLETARDLAGTALQIVNAGVKDPVIFELVGLLQEGVGADLISDMTLMIILPDVIAFNQRIIRRLDLASVEVALVDERFRLPCTLDTNDAVLLLPEDILSPLPVAYSWDDIDIVAGYNARVRQHINALIGRTWRQATNRNRVTKTQLRQTLLRYPEALEELVRRYKGQPLRPYDFDDDPVGEFVWKQAADEFAAHFPLSLSLPDATDPNVIRQTVAAICRHFRDLIEANGLFQLLYDRDRRLKPERAAQLLFFGIADAHCAANNLDLSPECNSGRGPVDFKVSSGYRGRMNVEVKYSSNTKLLSGYEKQLPTYDKAEKTFHSIYLVLRTTDSDRAIKRLEQLRNDTLARGGRAPETIFVDARFQPSASHIS